MRLAVWKLVAGRSAPVSRMRTPASAGEPAPAAGVYARWSRVGRRPRLRRSGAVAAAVQARLRLARRPRERGQSVSVAEARGAPRGVQQGGDETGRGPGNVSEVRIASRRRLGAATATPRSTPVALPRGRPRRARLQRGPEGRTPLNQAVGLGRGGGDTDSLAAQRVLFLVVEERPHAAPPLRLDEVRAADARVSRGADTWPAPGSVLSFAGRHVQQ